ncbi:MAG: hypothetical protein NTV60_02055 [Candidatus Kaiserbacteria bacterium]|nr:hypothetical protein [Candidatus Kaiserbacteria bacterium]
MPDEPLRPFAPPAFFESGQFGSSLGGNFFSAGLVVEWVLYVIFAFWAIYTFIAVYHWMKYSHASWVAFPAIATHLLISFALMSYALSGNAFFFTSYLP